MRVNAGELYKALLELGKPPKTVKVEEIVRTTDEATGKVRNKTDSSRHAVVLIQSGSSSVSVDLDKLRMLAKKLKTCDVELIVRNKFGITVTYPGGYFHLCDFETVPTVALDIRPLILKEDNRKG